MEGLKIFKLSHHTQIMVQIEVMKNEVITYQTPADSIKSLVERKDDKGQNTFDILDWWKENCAKLPAFTSDYIHLSIQSQFNIRSLQ